MANNRYFMLCPCGSTHYLGKSFGDGICSTTSRDELTESVREWMWEHLTGCPRPDLTVDPILGPEWVDGEIFKVITEGDERAPAGPVPPLIYDPRLAGRAV